MLMFFSLVRLGGTSSSAGSRTRRNCAVSWQEETEHHRQAGWLQPQHGRNHTGLGRGTAGIMQQCARTIRIDFKTKEKSSPHAQSLSVFFLIELGVFFSQSAGGYFRSESSFANFQGALQTDLPSHHSAVARQCLWVCTTEGDRINAHCSRE